MWRKSEPNDPNRPEPRPSQTPPSVASREPLKTSERATIGPSIAIQGDVTGEEDLIIQGRVEGKVDLKQHSVTIGKNGRVRADVYGRTITVEGEVQGDLFGEEQIIVRQSGRVEGDITAPRVSLEDGARFKGSIDMESRKGRPATLSRSEAGAAAAKPATEVTAAKSAAEAAAAKSAAEAAAAKSAAEAAAAKPAAAAPGTPPERGSGG